MSRRQLDNWIESFLSYTDDTEPRETYRRWTALSTVAAALQRKCFLVWGRETFYPNLYIILVGPPAARKGTAMKEGGKLLNKIGLSMAADESSRQKLISGLRDCNAAEQAPDGTLNQHCSMTIYATELTTFIGYESREMLTMLCKWFDCEERYVYDTHGR